MKAPLLAFALVIASPLAADSAERGEDDRSVQGILATAKMAGACGIMDSLIHFQKTTKINGGDDFVARFWALEATRLGMSVKQYSDQCSGAVSAYDRLWKTGEEASTKKK